MGCAGQASLDASHGDPALGMASPQQTHGQGKRVPACSSAQPELWGDAECLRDASCLGAGLWVSSRHPAWLCTPSSKGLGSPGAHSRHETLPGGQRTQGHCLELGDPSQFPKDCLAPIQETKAESSRKSSASVSIHGNRCPACSSDCLDPSSKAWEAM